jgi:hypothetical protein
MMGNSQECREQAKKCLKQARTAPTLLVMTKFESLAHSWLRLAEDLERAEALLEQVKVSERKAN